MRRRGYTSVARQPMLGRFRHSISGQLHDEDVSAQAYKVLKITENVVQLQYEHQSM